MIDFTCPNCDNVLKVPKQHLGATGTCNKCQARITITERPEPQPCPIFDDNGFEDQVLVEEEEERFELECWVAGVSHSNDDGTSRQRHVAQCKEGDPLILALERGNPYDANAIAVFNPPRRQVGHLPAGVAEELAPIMRTGKNFSAVVNGINPKTDTKPYLGLSITIIEAPGPSAYVISQARTAPTAQAYEPQARRQSPFAIGFQAALGVVACLILLQLAGCFALMMVPACAMAQNASDPTNTPKASAVNPIDHSGRGR